MVTFTIYGKLPNLNDYTKACRTNRFAGNNMKKKAEKTISAHILSQIPEAHFDDVVKLNFRWYEQNARRDLDNICFAKKFILDALVSNNIINNDNWKGVAGFTDHFFIDKENPRIEVDIFLKGEEE